jgi:hypothetical protein
MIVGQKSFRHLERLIQKNYLWLEDELPFSEEVYGTNVATQSQEVSVSGPSRGRPV